MDTMSDKIDKDNLKRYDSVGTFRWNDSIQLKPVPAWDPQLQLLLRELDQGWKGYVAPRFEAAAVDDTINVEPH